MFDYQRGLFFNHWSTIGLPLAYHGCSYLSQGYGVAAQVGAHVDGHVSGSQQHLHLVALQMIHGALQSTANQVVNMVWRFAWSYHLVMTHIAMENPP